jgi:hypothetical protein
MGLTQTSNGHASKCMRSSEGPDARIAARGPEFQICSHDLEELRSQQPEPLQPYLRRVL